MKRKIVNGFLMLTLVASTMGSFVSCKDYEEDNYIDLRNRIAGEASLREALQKEVDALKGTVTDLQTAQAACKQRCDSLKNALAAHMTDADSKYMKISDYAWRIANNEAAITTINLTITSIQSTLTTIQNKMGQIDINTADIATLKGQVAALQTGLSEAKALAQQALTLAQKNETDIVGLKTAVASLQSQVANFNADITNALNKATTALDKANEAYADAQANQVKIIALEALISQLQKQVADQGTAVSEELKNEVADLKADIDKLEKDWTDKIEAAKNEAKKYTDQLEVKINEALTNAIAELRPEIAAALQAAQTADAKAVAAQTAADAADAKAVAAQAAADAAQGTADEAVLAAAAAQAAAEAADAKAVAAQAAADAAQAAADAAQAAADLAQEKADANEIKIAELEAALDNYVTTDEFNLAIGVLAIAIEALDDSLTELSTTLDNLKQDVKSMITGIIIQGAESPVVGYLNVPLDVKTMILAAYHGKASSNGFSFPTENSENYVNGDEVFSMREFKVLNVGKWSNVEGYVTKEANEVFVADKDASTYGNAGKVYLSVNPSSIDFTGKTLTLTTSTGNQSGIKLSPLRASDNELKFGAYITRAGQNFYEADATLDVEDISAARATVNVNFSDMKSDAKQALEKRNVTSILQLGWDFIKAAEGVSAPAYGIRAAWQNSDGEVNSVVSEYNLCATTVKPLSFAFLKDLNVKRVPGVKQLQKLVGKIIGKVKIDFPKIETDEIHFGKVNLRPDGTYAVTYSVKIVNPLYGIEPGQPEYLWVENDEDGKTHEIVIDEEFTDDINALIAEINRKYTDETVPNSIASQMGELLNDVKEFNKMDQVVEDAKNDLVKEINSYITKFENKVLKFINNANKALQPTMLAISTNGKMGLLSESVDFPTKVSGVLNLHPTSYTLELFAPAYKKFVAVANVYRTNGEEVSENTAKYLASKVNKPENNMLKVIDGDEKIIMTADKDYIYEIVYSAIDYDGKIVVKRFYVQF